MAGVATHPSQHPGADPVKTILASVFLCACIAARWIRTRRASPGLPAGFASLVGGAIRSIGEHTTHELAEEIARRIRSDQEASARHKTNEEMLKGIAALIAKPEASPPPDPKA
ncbi:MAG: hypothetical protein JWN86_725 [Planctomycetota bacterium]|nr:hypothetical protein [Planctomycetota bacterium]